MAIGDCETNSIQPLSSTDKNVDLVNNGHNDTESSMEEYMELLQLGQEITDGILNALELWCMTAQRSPYRPLMHIVFNQGIHHQLDKFIELLNKADFFDIFDVIIFIVTYIDQHPDSHLTNRYVLRKLLTDIINIKTKYILPHQRKIDRFQCIILHICQTVGKKYGILNIILTYINTFEYKTSIFNTTSLDFYQQIIDFYNDKKINKKIMNKMINLSIPNGQQTSNFKTHVEPALITRSTCIIC